MLSYIYYYKDACPMYDDRMNGQIFTANAIHKLLLKQPTAILHYGLTRHFMEQLYIYIKIIDTAFPLDSPSSLFFSLSVSLS